LTLTRMMNERPSAVACHEGFSCRVQDVDDVAASFGARFMALLIDCFLLSMVYFSGIFLAGYSVLDFLNSDLRLLFDLSILFSLFVLLGPLFLCMSYFTVLHAYGGQTVGKAVMGIKVVAVSGGYLGYRRSLIRWMGYNISAAPLLAGFLWAVLDADKRAWHDILAGSRVVNDNIS